MYFLGASADATAKKAAAKKKKSMDVVLRPKATSEYALPKWTPWAVGGLGIAAVVLILLTAKGKD